MALLRLVFWIFALAALAWFATNVQLGDKTLWGHLQAIFATKEAKDLAKGTEEEAKKVAEKLRHGSEQAADGGVRPRAPGDGKAEEDLTPEERKALRDMVKERLHKQAAQPH